MEEYGLEELTKIENERTPPIEVKRRPRAPSRGRRPGARRDEPSLLEHLQVARDRRKTDVEGGRQLVNRLEPLALEGGKVTAIRDYRYLSYIVLEAEPRSRRPDRAVHTSTTSCAAPSGRRVE